MKKSYAFTIRAGIPVLAVHDLVIQYPQRILGDFESAVYPLYVLDVQLAGDAFQIKPKYLFIPGRQRLREFFIQPVRHLVTQIGAFLRHHRPDLVVLFGVYGFAFFLAERSHDGKLVACKSRIWHVDGTMPVKLAPTFARSTGIGALPLQV